jgi:hypothetical protein
LREHIARRQQSNRNNCLPSAGHAKFQVDVAPGSCTARAEAAEAEIKMISRRVRRLSFSRLSVSASDHMMLATPKLTF